MAFHPDNLFGLDPEEVLNADPRTAFFSFQNQFGRQGTGQRRFFQDRFQQIHNEFLGRLGEQLRGGQNPDQTFTNFLGNFNFGDRFRSTAPSLRGEDTRRFAPPTRFQFGGGGSGGGGRFGGFF